MARDTLLDLLEAVKRPSADLTENANFVFLRGGGGGAKWHLELLSPTWLETPKFSFGGGGGVNVALSVTHFWYTVSARCFTSLSRRLNSTQNNPHGDKWNLVIVMLLQVSPGIGSVSALMRWFELYCTWVPIWHLNIQSNLLYTCEIPIKILDIWRLGNM